MPIRTFRTDAGQEWRVWCVIPGNVGNEERRAGYDRRSPDPVLKYRGPERRVNPDRRRRAQARLVVPDGWLVFESGDERRRLTPIPPRWEAREERDLLRLWERAEPAPPPRPAGESPPDGPI